MSKKVVGIAMGGYSSEREISIESGNAVYKALPQSRWDCYRIVVDKDLWTVIDNQEKQYPLNLENLSFKMDNKNVHFDEINLFLCMRLHHLHKHTANKNCF